LDTDVVSDLRKPRPHGGVLAWIAGVEDACLHLSVVTLAEIQAVIEITRENPTPPRRHRSSIGSTRW
jgi:predicted nucleic acid-binding protein